MTDWTKDLVLQTLLQAGRTQRDMIVHGLKPMGTRTSWPEYASNVSSLDEPCEVSRPTKGDIDHLDLVQGWVERQSSELDRIVLRYRMTLDHEDDMRFTWAEVGARRGLAADACRVRCNRALTKVAAWLNAGNYEASERVIGIDEIMELARMPEPVNMQGGFPTWRHADIKEWLERFST